MKDTFIAMEKSHNAKEFIIFIPVKCFRKIMINTCEIPSILFIQPKKLKIDNSYSLLFG